VLIVFQYEIQQDARRVLVCEPESRLLLVAPPICRHAPSASVLTVIPHVHPQLTFSTEDTLPSREPSVPFLPPRLCSNLSLVPASPVHTHIPLWSRDDLCTLPPPCPRWSCLDGKWHLESRRSGSSWMCSRPRWMVHEGCLDERDGRQTDDSERCPGFTVCFPLSSQRATDKCVVFRKRLFGDI